MNKDELRLMIREAVEEGLKDWAAAGLLGAAVLNPQTRAMMHLHRDDPTPIIQKVEKPNKTDAWGDVETLSNRQQKASQELGQFSKDVMNTKDFFKEEGLNKNKLKALGVAGVVGASALINQKLKPASYQAHPSISQTYTNKPDPWIELQKDIEYRDRISKKLGASKRVPKKKV